jgi:hypothetical protein
MSALAFAASLVRSLAWPAALVVLAGMLFREQIREVIRKFAEQIRHLRTVRAAGAELTFDSDELADVKADVHGIHVAQGDLYAVGQAGAVGAGTFTRWAPTESPGRAGAVVEVEVPEFRPRDENATSISSRYRLQAMTIRSAASTAAPAVTVLSAWSCLEALIREIARLTGVKDTGSLTLLTNEVITDLNRRGGLPAPDRTRSVIQQLHSLKLPVERGAPVTKLEAMDYAETALKCTEILLTAYTTTQAAPEVHIDTDRRNEPADP